jgi:hypothetical protein
MRQRGLKLIMLIIIACFLLVVIPGSAVRSAEQSVADSLTRGGRFTVTITGLPNSSYYIWIPHTSSMTGEPRDQPPYIADSQTRVEEDPETGPWTIGSYQYNNGGGQTIRDDIAPSTPDMPNTQYYALVTTDSTGQATVEFRTSIYTGLRSYSVRVENPRSIDSDTLMVEVQVYSRRAPSVIEIFTSPETVLTTSIPATTTSTPTVTTIPVTTTAEPVQTTLPLPATTKRSAPETMITVIAAGAVILLAGRQ